MKLINKKWLLILPAMVFFGACTEMGLKKTKTGLQYKVFPSEKGEKFKYGDWVKFNIRISYKDSTLAETYGSLPEFIKIDSFGSNYNFLDVLPTLKVGDSFMTYQLYDTLVKRFGPGSLPFMKKGDKLKTTLKILAAYKTSEEAQAESDKEINNLKIREIASIENYIKKKGIKAEKKDGIYVEILEKGTGAATDSGKLVYIKYTGYNFEGKYFDSNQDSAKQTTKHPLDPIEVESKSNGAIPGFIIGIGAFNKGGKGRIYIPASMAYGPQGRPPVIKPNENLIFDIEVVDVKEKEEIKEEPINANPSKGNTKKNKSKLK